MPDTSTVPSVTEVFNVGVFFTVVVSLYFYLTSVQVNGGPTRWERWMAAFKARYVMSRAAAQSIDQESNEEPAFSSATTTPQNSNNALQSGATDSNELLRGQARALAIAVKAGKWGETDGIKAVFGVSASSTNPRYVAARAMLKEELARLESSAEFRQDDGTTAPASRPVTGQRRPA